MAANTLNGPGVNASFAYDAANLLTATTDSLGNMTRFEYDVVGNLTSITDPLDNTSTRTYDQVSRLLTQTDPRGNQTTFAYDALNRLTQLVDALSGVTRFSYDGNGNLLTVMDALSHTITHTYDSMDRLATRTDPLWRAESFTYDGNGNLVSTTDRKGQTTQFEYDPLNRRVRSTFADSTTSSYLYDAAGRLAQADDTADPHRPISLAYDTLDRLVNETTALGAVAYQYDPLGRRTKMTVNDLSPVNYTYDAASRLRTITQAPLNPVSIDYDAFGRRTTLTLPNGVSTEYRYDADSRLTGLIYRNAAGMLGDLTYTYDATGNRTGVGGSFARTLIPDPVVSASYDAANQQLTFGDKTMTYDANGNLTTITDPSGTTTFTWDGRNRLSGLDGPGVTASFAYDAFGRRGEKTLTGQTTQYVYDGADIIHQVDPIGTTSYLRSLTIDEALGFINRDGTYFSIYDPIGSTVAVTDSTATSLAQYTYDPFGTTSSTNPAFPNPFQYTRRENDGTGLYFYRARYYQPGLARFISEDPLGFRDGINLYTYVRNRPTIASDPLGLLTAVVHGVQLQTPRPGTYSGTELANAIREAGERVVEVRWSGNPFSEQASSEALNQIADYTAQAAATGEPFNIIGHSWGSVLAANYLAGTGQPADLLVTMGSPLNALAANPSSAKVWINISSPADPISWGSVTTGAEQALTGVSHTGYWRDPVTISEIVKRIKEQKQGRKK